MATTGYTPIAQPATATNLLPALLGTSTSGSTDTNALVQAIQNAIQSGTQAGSSTASTVNTAQLDPLLQAFASSSAGMDPATMQALITSVFQEGAKQVPDLTNQYANATGSRVTGNSGLQLATGELNRNLSTQAVQALLQYQQQSQQTAANAAAQIAANTRATQQQGTSNQANQQQTSTNTTTANQQQVATQAQTGVNPNMAGLVGLGGLALSAGDKLGLFKNLFGNKSSAASAATGAGAGTIAGGNSNSLLPTAGTGAPVIGASPMTIGAMGTPTASSGLLAAPTPVAGTGTNISVGGAPVSGGSNAGSTAIGGLGGTSGIPSFNFGSGLPDGFSGGSSFFGGGGLDPAAIGVGLNGFTNNGVAVGGDFLSGGGGSLLDAGPSAGAISIGNGFGPDLSSQLGTNSGLLSSLGSSISSGFGGIGDMIGSAASGIGDWLSGLFANGGMIGQPLGYADGGQVQTGATPQRQRNRDYMGAQDAPMQATPINYSGYAPAAGVGASLPAGAVSAPTNLALSASPAAAPQQQAGMITADQYAQMLSEANAANQAKAAQLAAISQGGGSGGVGEGGSPTSSATDGTTTGNIGSVGSAVGTGLGLAGITGLPPLGLMGMALAAISNQIAAAANAAGTTAPSTVGQVGAVSSPVSVSNPVGIAIGPAATNPNNQGDVDSVAATNGIGDGGSGVGGSSGTSAGGSTGGSSSGEGGNGGGNYANGGMIMGPGTGTSDSIPAKNRTPGGKPVAVSDGEFIIPADVVAALGQGTFQSIIDAFHAPA